MSRAGHAGQPESARTCSGLRGTDRADVHCRCDEGSGSLGVHDPDAVPRLDHAELDPLATEGNDARGPDVEADGSAGHEHFKLARDGIDPVDDAVN